MMQPPRRLSPGFLCLIALAMIVALLPWWRNHGYLRDLFDYGLVLASNGYLDNGERPYVDYTTPIQAGFLGLNWMIERMGGGTYAGLTRGAAALIVGAALLLPLLLARRWPGWAALMVGGVVTIASASQHTILWHNSLGVFCLALVSWSAACAPVLRRADWSWHLITAAGLFLGGINKLNFHLIALAAVLAWALRAALTGRASWGRMAATLLAGLTLGVVLPVACELAWTGASLRLWLANVVQLAADSRLDTLQKIFSADFLFHPVHDYYGPLLLPQAGLLGAWWSAVTLGGCWPAAGAPRADRVLLPLAIFGITAAGAALLATNFEIANLGLAAWLVLAVSVWLGFDPPPRRAVCLVGGLLPVLLFGISAGMSAWAGQRSQFGYSTQPRSDYVAADTLHPKFARLAGLHLPPNFAHSLKSIELGLPEPAENGRYPVFYAAGLEFVDRFFPSTREKGQPLWMHWGTTYGPTHTAQLIEQFARKEHFQTILCSLPFDFWPDPVKDQLQANYTMDLIGPVFRLWIRRNDDAISLRDSLACLTQLGGNVDGRMLHLHRESLIGWRLQDGRHLLGSTRKSGQVLLQVPLYRLAGVAILERRPDAGDGPLRVYVKVILHGAIPEEVRWAQEIELPAGEQLMEVPFAVDGSGRRLQIWFEQPPEQTGKLLVGVRDLTINHAMDVAGDAPRLHDEILPDTSAIPGLAPALFGDLAWRPQELVARGGRPGPVGWELPAKGEVWLRTAGMSGEIQGKLVAAPDAAVPTMVQVLWYKGGRLQVLQQLWVTGEGPVDFKAWTAEPGGWIGVVAAQTAGAAPVSVQFSAATLTP